MRKDGFLVKPNGDFNSIFPYLMKRKCDSQVFSERIIEVDKLLQFVKEKKREGHNISVFHVITIAIVKTLQERPHANRFIMGRRLYQHKDIEVSFITKRDFSDDATETSVKIKFDNEDTPKSIVKKMYGDVEKVKNQSDDNSDTDKLIKIFLKLPRLLLRIVVRFLEWCDFYFGIPKAIYDFDPLHCSLFMSNFGSINLESVYHHVYEWGNCSLFMSLGRIGKRAFSDRGGNVVTKNVIDIKFTVDERISDGYYMARTIDHFENYLLNPEKLNIEL